MYEDRARSIFLVRHGETEANASRIVQMPDVPLSQRGIVQAERLAMRLAGHGVDAIVSSDYARAQMTAEHIRAVSGAAIELWPELRERNFGVLRGRPYAECPADIFAPDYAPPGGETWGEFHARIARAWAKILAVAVDLRGNLAVVSHGLVCRSVVERLVGLGDRTTPAHWPNASLTIVTAESSPTLVRLNCTDHVADLVSRTAPDGG